MSHSGTIRWLRECYRADRSRVGVRDFYGGDVKLRQMTRDEERMLVGGYGEVLLTPAYGRKAMDYAALYRREREVVYGALFVCGKRGGKVHRAPLVLYEAGFDDGDGYVRLQVDFGVWRLNPAALVALDGGKEFDDLLQGALAGGELGEGVVGAVRRLIEEYCSGVDVSSLMKWPYLEASGDVEKAGGGRKMFVMAACGLGNVARSVGARGVLDEMEQLAGISEREYSGALLALLEGDVGENADGGSCLFVPTTLSGAQEKILRSARENALTVCHGPPGTGKSFTIAAIALDHVARGESVLVASSGDHAVDVMHEKIDEMLDGEEATVRAGRKEYLRELKSYLELILSGRLVEDIGLENLGLKSGKIRGKIEEIERAEGQLEEEFAKSISRGKTLADPYQGWVNRLKRYWIERSVQRRPLLCELAEFLETLHVEREGLVREHSKRERLCRMVGILDRPLGRKDIQVLLKGLRKRKGSEQEKVFEDVSFQLVLGVLPIWLAKSDDVHRVLPMERELFDVAIIDEASQCDLASVLPILQRAKRVVVAGDTKQLRHVSFLSVRKMEEEARDAQVSEEVFENLNYRERSLMDVAADGVWSGGQSGFLDEHFRSEKPIIEFSNQRFYHGVLKVMREKPWVNSDAALRGVLVKGKRGENGVNVAEVDAVLGELVRILGEEKDRKITEKRSVGVLSPFRAQVDAILEAVRERMSRSQFSRLIGDHQLLIGTAHSFQGAERDRMVISMGVDGESSSAVLRFVEREDVFNVSVTRARIEQSVVYSVDSGELPVGGLLGDYLRHVDGERGDGVLAEEGCTDVFAREVASAFSGRGVEVILEGVVAGMAVDMVLQLGGRELGVDLVGYPGQMTQAVAQRKAQMLGRAGMKLVPLGYAEWVNRREECVERLMGLLRF